MLEQRKLFALWQKLGRIWCSLMHSSAMWPVHDEYYCRSCGRRFAVPWANSVEIGRSAMPPRRPQVGVVSLRVQVGATGPGIRRAA
jgi:hypothetical protein